MFKRHISLFIIAAMLCTATIGCAKGAETDASDASYETGASAAAETADPRDIDDGLPDVDYDGATFTLFCRDEVKEQYFTDEQNGEVVNDAIYSRNLKVEEDYNIKLDKFAMDGTWNNMTAYRKTISSAVLSGDQSFDLVEGNCVIADMLGNNYFCNWNDFDILQPRPAVVGEVVQQGA